METGFSDFKNSLTIDLQRLMETFFNDFLIEFCSPQTLPLSVSQLLPYKVLVQSSSSSSLSLLLVLYSRVS